MVMRLVCILLVLFFSFSNINCINAGVPVGVEANDFSLETTKGEQVSLVNFRGKNPVVLTFWTTWCPYCVKEMDELKNMYSKLKSDGLEVLAVNIQEDKTLVSRFVSSKNLEFPILFDFKGSVARDYGVSGIPALFLIDKDGKIRFQGNSLPDNYLELIR